MQLVPIVLTALLCSAGLALAQTPAAPAGAPKRKPATGFVQNLGQWDPTARFHLALPGLSAWVTSDGIVYDFFRERTTGDREAGGSSWSYRRHGHVVRMRFEDAEGEAIAESSEAMPGVFSYFRGNDESRWVRGARQFAAVEVRRLYAGIDLRVQLEENRLRYDVIVAPGADPGRVRMSFDGADRVSVLPTGELAITTSLGDVAHRGLRAFQEVDGNEADVACAFVVSDNGTVGFAVGAYDRTRPLVIDPIVFSTVIGEQIYLNGGAIAADVHGSPYITGWTMYENYPVTSGAYDTSYASGVGVGPLPPVDVVVTKLNPSGTVLVYSTYLGGTSDEALSRITVDRHDCAYIVGVTGSADFPLYHAVDSVLSSSVPYVADGFITKLDSTGTSLVYSSYLGGTDSYETGLDVAVDDSLFAYVSGSTNSNTFPTTGGTIHPTRPGGVWDGFLCRLAPDGRSFVFSTYLGGTGDDYCTSVGVDQIGRIYIGGYTNSPGMFTPGAVDSVVGGTSDGFVQRISPFGTVLMNSTLIGGSGYERDVRIAVDTTGVVYLAGNTGSTDLAVTPNAFQTNFRRIFAARLSFDFTSYGYLTYFGGTRLDVVRSVALGKGGFLCVVGQVLSTDFFTKPDAVQRSLRGPSDAYMSIIRPSGGTLEYSTYLGGSNVDEANGAAFDLFGNVFVSGVTFSSDFPTTAGAYDPVFDPEKDTNAYFVTKIGRCTLTLNAGEDQSICVGDTVTIGGIASRGVPEYVYRWESTDTTIGDRSAPVITVSPRTTTRYVLIASDVVGCAAIDTVTVRVHPLPVVLAGSDTTICDGGSARIGSAARSGTAPYSYAWTPSTGLDSPVSATPTARPATTTVYSVTVSDSAGCVARDTVVVNVNMRPEIDRPALFEICPGDTVTLGVTITQGTPPYTYRWSPATGLSSTTVAAPRAYPSVTTSYSVIVTDAIGCSTVADSIVVTVGGSLRTKIQVTGPMMLCAGDSVTLDAGDWARYRWSTGDTTRTIRRVRGGTFTVEVESASGCQGRSDTVVIGNGRTADPTIAGSLAGCAGSEAVYEALSTAPVGFAWRHSGSAGRVLGASDQDTLRIEWLRAGVDTLQLITTSRDGCLDSSRIIVVIAAATRPVLSTQPVIRICQGDATSLDAGAYAGYLWSTGETTRRIDIRTAGLYWVTVTDAAGCTARSDTVRVEVAALPVPTIVASSTGICPGDSASLSAPPDYASYRWSTGETTRTIVVRAAGRYTVTVVDSMGCTGTSAEEAITVYPSATVPRISMSGDTLIATPAVAWQWYMDGAPIAGATARRLIGTPRGSYTVGIVDSNGCTAMSLPATLDRRYGRMDTVTAALAERVKLAVRIAPGLRPADGIRHIGLRLRVRPTDLYATGVSLPQSATGASEPTVQNRRDGTIEVVAELASALSGDTLVLVELMGLATARPEAPVWIDSAVIGAGGGAPVTRLEVSGNGLVRLEGCELGVFAVGRRVNFTGVRVEAGTLLVEYRAAPSARPELRLIDVSGRIVRSMELTEGTNAAQQARLDTRDVASGVYIIELRDRDERVTTSVQLAK